MLTLLTPFFKKSDFFLLNNATFLHFIRHNYVMSLLLNILALIVGVLAIVFYLPRIYEKRDFYFKVIPAGVRKWINKFGLAGSWVKQKLTLLLKGIRTKVALLQVIVLLLLLITLLDLLPKDRLGKMIITLLLLTLLVVIVKFYLPGGSNKKISIKINAK